MPTSSFLESAVSYVVEKALQGWSGLGPWRWGDYLDYVGEGQCNHSVKRLGKKDVMERTENQPIDTTPEKHNQPLLASEVGPGATNQREGGPRKLGRWRNGSPPGVSLCSRRIQPWDAGASPGDPFWTRDLQTCNTIDLWCFKPPSWCNLSQRLQEVGVRLVSPGAAWLRASDTEKPGQGFHAETPCSGTNVLASQKVLGF